MLQRTFELLREAFRFWRWLYTCLLGSLEPDYPARQVDRIQGRRAVSPRFSSAFRPSKKHAGGRIELPSPLPRNSSLGPINSRDFIRYPLRLTDPGLIRSGLSIRIRRWCHTTRLSSDKLGLGIFTVAPSPLSPNDADGYVGNHGRS